MFRDSRGIVHTVSSADPLADLPAGAAAALQHALLDPPSDRPVDLGSILERCGAARELLEHWQDAFFVCLPGHVDLAEEARYAAAAGLSLQDVESGYDGDEGDEPADEDDEYDLMVDLAEPADEDPRRLLPEHLVHVLERELLLLPLRVRLEALVAATDLVLGWTELIADREKLLGHLVLAHREPQRGAVHEALVARHARLHRLTGPTH